MSNLWCMLGGAVEPYSQQRISELYQDHEDYLIQYRAAADHALEQGFLLQPDYDTLMQQAMAADIF